MSNIKEFTLNNLFTLSVDSTPHDNISLLSDQDFDLQTGSFASHNKQIQELLLEIELINEDRHRLKRENEVLRSSLEKLPVKTLQIELLSKIATKALDENFLLKKSKCPSPIRKFSHKINIKSPSQGLPRTCGNLIIPLKKNFELSTSASPLKSHRNNSSKIRVCRNYQKYPK